MSNITNIYDLFPNNYIQKKNIEKSIKKGIINAGQFVILDGRIAKILYFYFDQTWWRNDDTTNDLIVRIDTGFDKKVGTILSWDVNCKRLRLMKSKQLTLFYL